MFSFKKAGIVCILIIIISLCSFAFAAKANLVPKFALSKVKIKLGEIQSIGTLLQCDNFDVDRLVSSAPGVVRVMDNGNLKAVSTGISTITYTYKVGESEKEIYCYVEVTTDTSTYAEVKGVASMNIKISLELDGVTTIVDSNKGAIPAFPDFKRGDLILDGWYYDKEYTSKLGERDRLSKDTTLYGRWLTKEEYQASTTKVFVSSYYDDINDHWGRLAIEATTSLGLFNGVSERTFGPEVKMTRAMAIAVIGRLEKAEVEGKKSGVSDVKEGAYYDGYLAWAIENKIVTDVKDDNFRPNDEITREEMAIYMANLMEYRGFKVNTLVELTFNDVSELSIEARQAIKQLYNAGIMQGTGEGSFSPKATTTRAQMAQIFYNYYNYSMKYKA